MKSSAIPPLAKNNPAKKNEPKASRVLQQSTGLPQLAKQDDLKRLNEIYDSILWRIDAKAVANETMAIGLTGCSSKSGVSTIAANLALRASRLQRGRVLLIDANWEFPGLFKTFGLTPGLGLYDVLSGDVSPRECEPQAVNESLEVLCRGRLEEDQPALVRQEMVDEMLGELKTEYSLILVDLPLADALKSALPLARKLDGNLLVTRFEAVKQAHVQRTLRRLQEDHVEVWGSLLNRHREYVPRWLRNWH